MQPRVSRAGEGTAGLGAAGSAGLGRMFPGGCAKGGEEPAGDSPQAEDEPQLLHGSGICKWFNVRMGFGFLSMTSREGTALDSPVDVFVHQVGRGGCPRGSAGGRGSPAQGEPLGKEGLGAPRPAGRGQGGSPAGAASAATERLLSLSVMLHLEPSEPGRCGLQPAGQSPRRPGEAARALGQKAGSRSRQRTKLSPASKDSLHPGRPLDAPHSTGLGTVIGYALSIAGV